MQQHQTLLLDEPAIARLLDIKTAIAAVEKAFLAMGQGRAHMPAKIYLNLGLYHGDFRAMPAWVESFPECSLKWVNVHPENAKRGLPTVMALIVLSDPKTGLPRCIMAGGLATAIRTGAAGAVAAKYLARPDARRAALVGCGVQARYQLQGLLAVGQLETVTVWGPKPGEAAAFLRQPEFKQVKGLRADSVEACVAGADIVVTTTPSREPLVRRAWLKPGAHINAIGADAPGKQELEPDILRNARVVVDSREQAMHSGEINVPLRQGLFRAEDIYAELGEIVVNARPGRSDSSGLTVFDSTGLAIQDTAVANVIYRRAKARRLGKRMRFM